MASVLPRMIIARLPGEISNSEIIVGALPCVHPACVCPCLGTRFVRKNVRPGTHLPARLAFSVSVVGRTRGSASRKGAKSLGNLVPRHSNARTRFVIWLFVANIVMRTPRALKVLLVPMAIVSLREKPITASPAPNTRIAILDFAQGCPRVFVQNTAKRPHNARQKQAVRPLNIAAR